MEKKSKNNHPQVALQVDEARSGIWDASGRPSVGIGHPDRTSLLRSQCPKVTDINTSKNVAIETCFSSCFPFSQSKTIFLCFLVCLVAPLLWLPWFLIICHACMYNLTSSSSIPSHQTSNVREILFLSVQNHFCRFNENPRPLEGLNVWDLYVFGWLTLVKYFNSWLGPSLDI